MERRMVAIAAVFVALLGAAVVVGTGDRAGRAHAATGTCVEHSKHVVTHVKRHGKRTRVVRLKHYWTCEEAPVASAPAAASPAAPSRARNVAAARHSSGVVRISVTCALCS